MSQAVATHALSGVLDLSSVVDVLGDVRSALAGTDDLVLDLAGVQRADSAALTLLVASLREAARRKARLRFRNLPADLLKIAQVTGLDGVLSAYTTGD